MLCPEDAQTYHKACLTCQLAIGDHVSGHQLNGALGGARGGDSCDQTGFQGVTIIMLVIRTCFQQQLHSSVCLMRKSFSNYETIFFQHNLSEFIIYTLNLIAQRRLSLSKFACQCFAYI